MATKMTMPRLCENGSSCTNSPKIIDLEDLRCNRKLLILAIKDYFEKIGQITSCSFEFFEEIKQEIKILKSIKFTAVRLPANIIPEKFVRLIKENNGTKKYIFNFVQNDEYIDVIVVGKPLMTKGQVIFLYFLRELLQYFERCQKESRRQRGLSIAARKI